MTACGCFSVKVVDTAAGGQLREQCLMFPLWKNRQISTTRKNRTRKLMIDVLPERQLTQLILVVICGKYVSKTMRLSAI